MLTFAVAAAAIGDIALAIAICVGLLLSLLAMRFGISVAESRLAALREFEGTGDESKLPRSIRRNMATWRKLHPGERLPWEEPGNGP